MLPLVGHAPKPRTCLLIYNRSSRHPLDADARERVIEHAANGGWILETAESEFPGHATQLAREAALDGTPVVLVNGGDGTLNQAVNGIAGTETALAVLPGGTANVWAKEIGVPKNPLAALDAAMRGQIRRVDLGRANGHYFLLMAGVGLDGEVIEHVSPSHKRRFGALSYLAAAVPTAIRTRPWRVRMRVEDETLDTNLYWMVIGNTRSYGGFRNITFKAQADDGELDLAIMRDGGLFHLAVDGLRVFLHRHDRSPNVWYTRATSVAIETPGLPVQVDGEPHGETPMVFDIVPRALNVIVPAGARTPLFSTGEGEP